MPAPRPKLTRSAHERLTEELNRLRQKRQEVIAEVELTRSYGDLRENVGYHAAREAYGIIEGQIAAVQAKLANAEILDDDALTYDEVVPGVPVTVELDGTGQREIFTIVDGVELDSVLNGVSADSPIGEALLYARVGEQVEAELPRGPLTLTVIAIGH